MIAIYFCVLAALNAKSCEKVEILRNPNRSHIYHFCDTIDTLYTIL